LEEKIKIGDSEIRKLTQHYVKEYSEKLGLGYVPKIYFRGVKNYIGKARDSLLPTKDNVRKREIRINIAYFHEIFQINRRLAKKILKYVIAHEVGHLKMYLDLPIPVLVSIRARSEEEEFEAIADRYAKQLTGICFDECYKIEQKLFSKKERL
jgi:hypothetical protein